MQPKESSAARVHRCNVNFSEQAWGVLNDLAARKGKTLSDATLLDLPTGSVCVRYSDPANPEPFYLQRVLNDRAANGYFAVHLIENSFHDNLADAEHHAADLAGDEGAQVYVDPIAEAHRG